MSGLFDFLKFLICLRGRAYCCDDMRSLFLYFDYVVFCVRFYVARMGSFYAGFLRIFPMNVKIVCAVLAG